MKTLDQIIAEFQSDCIDWRDLYRLSQFIPEERLSDLGLSLKEGYAGTHEPQPFTRENVLAQLERDVAFGFEKALNKRGISALCMYEVIKMWNWVLEEGLEGFDDYAQYGLPLLKATAVKYGLNNPIGDDTGSEDKYSSEAGW